MLKDTRNITSIQGYRDNGELFNVTKKKQETLEMES